MATIKSKYDIFQEVWFVHENTLYSGIIGEINIIQHFKGYSIEKKNTQEVSQLIEYKIKRRFTHGLADTYVTKQEHHVYKTKAEYIKSL